MHASGRPGLVIFLFLRSYLSLHCQPASTSTESNKNVRTIFQTSSTAPLRLGCRGRGIRGRDRGKQEGVELGRKLGKGKGTVQ